MRALVLACLLLATSLAGCADTDPGDDDTDGGLAADDTGDGGSVSGDGMHPDCAAALADSDPQPTATPFDADNPVWRLETNCGTIRIELYVGTTPITAGNFVNLTGDGYFDGIKFHRVIDGFMIQGGDPNTKRPETRDNIWGTGGPGYSIRDEFPCVDGTTVHRHPGGYQFPADQCDGHGGFLHTHDGPGALSMANSGPNSGGSQFFITHDATPQLDGYHPVFGQVIEGQEVVFAIGTVEKTWDFSRREQARPVEPVVIRTASIE